MMKKLYLLLILLMISSPIIKAQEAEKPKEESKSEISVFIGGSTNKDATAFALGLDYQYRIKKIIGVGALIDVAFEDIGSIMIGPAAFIHVSNFEFTIAPCAEFSDDDIVGVLRLGVAYEFELSKFSISPSVNFDTERAGEETLVYGLSFGFDI
jgi:hypothetical protein